MINIVKITALSPREVHLRINSQLLPLISPIFPLLLLRPVVSQQVPENSQLIKIRLRKAVHERFDIRFTFDVG
jgi:hypothetical protein